MHLYKNYKHFSIIGLIAVFLGAPSAMATSRLPSELCENATRRQEAYYRIPSHLLQAISLAESGRWDKHKQRNTAWPWTVTANGEGRYYPTKRAAIRAVQNLKKRGKKNIDVGCMQINLKYHPNAFKSLNRAFDPVNNTAYAAEFLTKLRTDKRSWVGAEKHYHSSTRHLHNRYRAKVYKIWRAEKRKARYARTLRNRSLAQKNARHFSRAERLLADSGIVQSRLNWLNRTTRKLLEN